MEINQIFTKHANQRKIAIRKRKKRRKKHHKSPKILGLRSSRNQTKIQIHSDPTRKTQKDV